MGGTGYNLLSSYSHLSQEHRKQFLLALNHTRLNHFKARTQGEADCHKTHQKVVQSWSGQYSQEEDTHRYHFDIGDGLDIFVKTNMSRTTQIIWHATPEKLKKAKYLGLLTGGSANGVALTHKVITAVAGYRLKELERRFKNGIVSKRAKEKDAIIAHVIERTEALQGIERCISAYDKAKTATENFTTIQQALQEYEQGLTDKISALKNSGQAKQKKTKKIIACLETDLKQIKNLRSYLELNWKRVKDKDERAENWLKKTASPVLQRFLLQRLNKTISDAKADNEILTHNVGFKRFALKTGKLHNYLWDAEFAIRDYSFDQNHAITKSHQFICEDSDVHTFDSSQHTHGSREELKRLLLGMMEVENLNGAALVNETRFVGWRNFSMRSAKDGYFWKRLFNSLWLIGHIVNILENALFENAFISDFLFFDEHPTFKAGSRTYDTIKQSIGVNYSRWSTSVGKAIRHIWRVQIAHGVKEAFSVIEDKLMMFAWKFRHDYRQGYWKKLFAEADVNKGKCDQLCEMLNAEFQQLNEKSDLELKKVERDCKVTDLLCGPNKDKYLYPSRLLSPYHSDDILSRSIDGLQGFVRLIGDQVFAKHPLVGAVALFFYTTAGGISLMPSVMKDFFISGGMSKELAEGYVKFTVDLGQALAKGDASEVIASAFTQAKLVALPLEFLMHGPDSWLGKAGKDFFRDPGRSVVSLSACYLIGYLLVYKVDVPVISHHLKSDLGTFPHPTLTFAGAKLGVILHAVLEANKDYVDEDVAASLNLLLLLLSNRSQLPLLPSNVKSYVRNFISDIMPAGTDAERIASLFKPDRVDHKGKSMLSLTVGAILELDSCALRCFLTLLPFSPSFRSKAPWLDLLQMCKSGAAILTSNTGKVFSIAGQLTKVILRTLTELTFYPFIKLAGIFKKADTLINLKYKIYNNLDNQFAAPVKNTLVRKPINAICEPRMQWKPNLTPLTPKLGK